MTVSINGSLGVDLVQDGSVTTAKLADLAVSTAKLADQSVSLAKHASGSNPSRVSLFNSNGYGSTNTKIKRFLNLNYSTGSDITYTDSATLGSSFTINTSGIYSVYYSDVFTTGSNFGISLNTSAPTTNLMLLPIAEQLAIMTSAGATQPTACNIVTYLPAGSVVRPHTDGVASSGTYFNTSFYILRIA